MRWGILIVGGALLVASGLATGVLLQRQGAFGRPVLPANTSGGVQPPVSPAQPPVGPATSPELPWSREVAEMFLNSAVKADVVDRTAFGDALAFATEEYQQRLQAHSSTGKSAEEGLCREMYKGQTDFAGVLNQFYGRENWRQDHQDEFYRSWSIGVESLSPERNEAIFSGTLSAMKRSAGFKLFLTNEVKTNKWRVNDFRVEPKESGPSP